MTVSSPPPEEDAGSAKSPEGAAGGPTTLRPAAGPFGDIALSLSGGGYRAAAFHLGVLDLLRELNLLEDVTMLSTVSGGTITGAKYVVETLAGSSYEGFRQRMHDFLLNVDVVREATRNLYSEPGASQGRPLSLIRAAAQVYAEKLVGGARFAEILEDRKRSEGAGLGEGRGRFKELAFNATEFRTGVAFRFLSSGNPYARHGNGNLWVGESVVPHIHLADVIAASSCFPGVFEPMVFPDDFRWPAESGVSLESVRGELHENFGGGVALMDGGIFDNQGFSSLELAGERLDTEIGLIVISDTNQRSEPLYQAPVQSRRGHVTLAVWRLAATFVAFLSLATGVALIAQFLRESAAAGTSAAGFVASDPVSFLLLYLMPFALAASVSLLLFGAGSLIRRKRSVLIAGRSFDIWAIVKRLTLPDVFDLLETRFGSLYAMSSSVFLKRVRGLLLTAAARNKDYTGKVLFNVIYEMNLPHPSLYKRAPWLRPHARLTRSAAEAEKADTNLWSTSPEQLDNLVACGRATTCFNLLRFLILARAAQLADPASAESDLFGRARVVWDGMNGS